MDQKKRHLTTSRAALEDVRKVLFRVTWLLSISLCLLAACYRPQASYEPWKVPGSGETAILNTPQAPFAATPTPTRGLSLLPGEPSPTPDPKQLANTEEPLMTAVANISLTPAPLSAWPTPGTPVELPPLRAETISYTIRSGDTLAKIALNHQVSVRQILDVNQIQYPNLIQPDQVLVIPPASANELATNFKIVPDSEVFYSPSAADFDTASVIQQFNGYLNTYTQNIEDGRFLTGAQAVQEVADNFSINPRLLLALIEYRNGWMTYQNTKPLYHTYALGWADPHRSGLYEQLGWAANEITRGYTMWENRQLSVWTLADGTVMRIDPTINAGTAGLQYLFSLLYGTQEWKQAVSEQGFFATYQRMFGYPFAFSIDPLVPEGLVQPEMQLPLAEGDVWFLTGGPHWGWGTGSAWAALDFGPPGRETDYGCFESRTPVTAAADGLVVRSGNGAVVLDLDGDGSEQTGWTLLYMHIATEGRVKAGSAVKAGDFIGYPSCEGGVSNGTHFHIARRYNGVWIAADGAIPFNLEGWIASSTGNVYDGYLTKDGISVEAYNGRSSINEISR